MRIAKVGDRPYTLLRAVEGIDLVDLPDANVCCGFGGTFSMKNHETSTAMLTEKVANVKATKAEILCAGDYSCLMHIGGGLSRLNSRGADHAPRGDPRLDEGRPLEITDIDLVKLADNAVFDLQALDPTRTVGLTGINSRTPPDDPHRPRATATASRRSSPTSSATSCATPPEGSPGRNRARTQRRHRHRRTARPRARHRRN